MLVVPKIQKEIRITGRPSQRPIKFRLALRRSNVQQGQYAKQTLENMNLFKEMEDRLVYIPRDVRQVLFYICGNRKCGPDSFIKRCAPHQKCDIAKKQPGRFT